jgi:predicted transposase/invertase (TIGR01784 family)
LNNGEIKSKIEMIKKMLANNYTIEQIAEITNFTKEKILEIKNENK